MKKDFKGSILELAKGDIAEYDGDAVVNAANNHFWMGSGVAGAIKRKGGTAIEQEAMSQGPMPVGSAVITSGGTLKARFVIHAAVMDQDLQTDGGKIAEATRSALTLAESRKLSSIALPALGTGVGGFPLGEAARVMMKEVVGVFSRPHSLRRVTFILYDAAAYQAFENELKNIKS